jgi:hypothetical protein
MSMPSCYKKGEELEAELHISTRENCLQSPMLKKDTSWATISSTPLILIREKQKAACSTKKDGGYPLIFF